VRLVPLPPNASRLRKVASRNGGSRFSAPFWIEPTPMIGATRLEPPLASIVPGCV
jgi:hypothetical protein